MPTKILTLPRSPVGPAPATGVLAAGASARDITPALGGLLAGFGSLRGEAARRLWGRLFATALVLDDGAGGRVALVSVDLHAGTRYLVERCASLLDDDTGIGVHNLFLAGTHTHSGPGHIYGNTLYDGMSAPGRGLDQPGAERLAEGIAAAVRAAVAGLRPARVGHGVARRWGFSRNRSLRAFTSDGADPARFAAALAGDAGAPALGPDALAVDPRVQVLWAEDRDGLPIGAFATFAAHGTTIAARHAALSADWLGVAVREASERLRRADACWQGGAVPLDARPRVPVALAAGSIGDVDATLPGLDLSEVIARQGLDLALAVGEALGETLEQACLTARAACQEELRVTARFAEPRPAGAALADGRTLAPAHAFGLPVAGGSELGRNLVVDPALLDVDLGLESQRDPLGRPGPHAPKITLSPTLVNAITGRPADVLPLRLVMLDAPAARVWLFGVPGEPTTMESFRLEQALADLGATALMVAGVCGDYAGYFTTPKEYERQHYEGASTLWGRASGDWLIEQARTLARAEPPPPAPAARFEVQPFEPPSDLDAPPPPSLDHFDSRPDELAPRPSLSLEGGALVGRWWSMLDVLPPFGPGPWILFEEQRASGWVPLLGEGLRVDDQTHLMLIDREVTGGAGRWRFHFRFPGALAGKQVRFVLAPVDFDPDASGATSNPVRLPG